MKNDMFLYPFPPTMSHALFFVSVCATSSWSEKGVVEVRAEPITCRKVVRPYFTSREYHGAIELRRKDTIAKLTRERLVAFGIQVLMSQRLLTVWDQCIDRFHFMLHRRVTPRRVALRSLHMVHPGSTTYPVNPSPDRCSLGSKPAPSDPF